MNILLTSAGRRAYLVGYFKNALGARGKLYTSNSEYTVALKESDGYFISPLIYEENYVDSIIEYCKLNDITITLSLFDIDLLVLAKEEQKFKENGIQLILAPYESVYICNDKWETCKVLRSQNINTPKTFLSVKEARKAIRSGEISYPIVIKPRWGMGSLGLFFADNENELYVLYEKSLKKVFSSYLKYESSLTKEEPIIIQEKIIGKEYGIDVVNNLNEEYVTCLAKQKVAMRDGETDIGLTVSPKRFEAISKRLSSLIRHKGILSVDCFLTEENELFVMEMNCRISGHYPISHVAGFDFPRILIDWLEDNYVHPSRLAIKLGMKVAKKIIPVQLTMEK